MSAGDASARQRAGPAGWMVIDPRGERVCPTVYTRGAVEVVRRLGAWAET